MSCPRRPVYVPLNKEPFHIRLRLVCLFKANITMVELSKRTGIAYSTLNRFFNGRREPNLCNLKKILDAVKYEFSPHDYEHHLSWLMQLTDKDYEK